MNKALRQAVKGTLQKCNLALMPYSTYTQLKEVSRAVPAIDFILELREDQQRQLLKLWRDSKAQLFQDLFVLSQLDFKAKGFFVEFGAASGFDLSNSYLLEHQFGWTGILAEPCREWHSALKKNRTCHIETKCVWQESNQKLMFNATSTAEFSTIESFSESDRHAGNRKAGKRYAVETISLVDLLDKYGAPRVIDYLSIDTEGSEFDILNSFDFAKYQFRTITCEHNFTPQREKIHSLLTKNGYVRKLERFSAFDDWYVNDQLR